MVLGVWGSPSTGRQGGLRAFGGRFRTLLDLRIEVQGWIAVVGCESERIAPGVGSGRGARWVGQVWVDIGPRPGLPGIGVDAVAGSAHPADASLPNLVAECVGEGLDRVCALDLVAVVVEPDVEISEALLPVAAEDRSAGGAERPADQPDCVSMGGREGRLVRVGRLATSPVRNAGPEGFTQVVERVDHVDAAGGQLADPGVDLGELVVHP